RQRLPGEHLPHEDAPEGLRPRPVPVRGKGAQPVVQGADEDRAAPQARDRGALPRPQPGDLTPVGARLARDDTMQRTLTPLDRFLDSAQNALETVFGAPRAE